MAGASPVILILGAGPNIGQAVARTFASRGYKVALASRSLNVADSTDNQLNITSDFANSDDVVNAFQKVKKVFGIPSVVVYNGKSPEDSFEFVLKIHSQRLDTHPTSGPVRPSTGRFQSRYNNQYHQCFCRRTTSCPRFCTASCFCFKDIHLHWKYPECCYPPVISQPRSRKVRRRTYDLGCFSCI